jgi:hypothetical protein
MFANGYFAYNFKANQLFATNYFYEGGNTNISTRFDYDMPLHGRVQKNVFSSTIQKNILSAVIDS